MWVVLFVFIAKKYITEFRIELNKYATKIYSCNASNILRDVYFCKRNETLCVNCALERNQQSTINTPLFTLYRNYSFTGKCFTIKLILKKLVFFDACEQKFKRKSLNQLNLSHWAFVVLSKQKYQFCQIIQFQLRLAQVKYSWVDFNVIHNLVIRVSIEIRKKVS